MPPPKGYIESPTWTGRGFLIGKTRLPVLEYNDNFSGWSDELTTLHEETAGEAHPIDVASRGEALRQLTQNLNDKQAPVILEVGCSSGYLLQGMAKEMPHAVLVGADIVKAPMYLLSERLNNIPLMRFDLLQCPLPDSSFDAVVLLNVLEHIEDDMHALRQVSRLLKTGGMAVIEVPAGPELYDDYDKALMHFRRYRMADLMKKLEKAGLSVTRKSHLGYFVYPAFAHVKRRNKRQNQQNDITVFTNQASGTSSSLILRAAFGLERLIGRFVSYPVGIRCLVTAKKHY